MEDVQRRGLRKLGVGWSQWEIHILTGALQHIGYLDVTVDFTLDLIEPEEDRVGGTADQLAVAKLDGECEELVIQRTIAFVDKV